MTLTADETFAELHRIADRFIGCGELTEHGGRVVCHRPKLARFSYLHFFYPPADDAKADEVASLTGRQPRPEFRAFLRVHNGLNLFNGSIKIFGVRSNNDRTFSSAMSQPYDIGLMHLNPRVPVSADDMLIGILGESDRIVLTSDGEIYRYQVDSTNVVEKWTSLSNLLVGEAKRFDQYYDENGYLKPEICVENGKASPFPDMNMYELVKKANRPHKRLMRWISNRIGSV